MSGIQFTRSVQAKKATIYYDGENTMKCVIHEDAEMELEDVLEQRRICQELTNGRPHVLLVVAGSNVMATKEAREYAAKNAVPGRLAEALIVNSMAVRLMGNVYINYHKPNVPTRMFGGEEEAYKWLEGMYSQKEPGR